ncbi:hypothetical protein CSW57_24095, partial [Williamsia muralis]
MPEHGTVVGVLLAAGAQPITLMRKYFRHPVSGARAGVDALGDGGCGQVLVTVGAAAPEMPGGAQAVQVPDWRRGLSESVRVALLEAADVPDLVGVVLHVVDIPDVTGAQVRRLLDACGPRPGRLGRAVFAGSAGHPVYLGADHLDGVLQSLSGDRGANFLRVLRVLWNWSVEGVTQRDFTKALHHDSCCCQRFVETVPGEPGQSGSVTGALGLDGDLGEHLAGG